MTAGPTATSWEQQFRRHGGWIIVALAVAASITGITNDFAFDDVRAVYEDTRIHSLPSLWQVFTQTYWLPKYGASLYRPLTSLGFGLQWAIGNGSPLVFHIVSITAIVVAKAGLQLKPGDFRLVRFMKYADSIAVAGAVEPRSVN